MSFIRQITECIHNTATQPDISFLRKSKFLCNPIRCFKSNAPDIICHLKRIFFHFIQTFISVLTVNFCCKGRADTMILQKEHNVFDLFLPLPAVTYHFDSLFTNAIYFLQTGNICLDNFQRLRTKLCNNLFRIFRSNTFDQTGTKIFFNTKYRGRKGFFPALCHKLSAVTTVHFPVAVNQ